MSRRKKRVNEEWVNHWMVLLYQQEHYKGGWAHIGHHSGACPSSLRWSRSSKCFKGRKEKFLGCGVQGPVSENKETWLSWRYSQVKFNLFLNLSWVGHIRTLLMITAISLHNLKRQWILKEGLESVSLNIDLVIMEFVSFGPGNP